MCIPNFATHYYLPERGPFRSLSDLPQGNDDPVFIELLSQYKRDPGCRRRYGVDYIDRRLQVETTLRDLFVARGGKPIRKAPYYMTLGECPWFRGLNDRHHELRIELSQLNPLTTSLTFPDSFVAMTRSDKPYYQKVYFLDEIIDFYATYDLPRKVSAVSYDRYWETDFEVYVEVQVWAELGC